MGAGCPILAITDNKRTFRQLGLAWNVHPVYVEAKSTIDETVEAGIEKLKVKGILEAGDKVIVVQEELQGDKVIVNKYAGVDALGGTQ